MSDNNKIEISVEKGVKELIIREGKALDVFNKNNVFIDGNISAPRNFIEKRFEDSKQNERHAIVNRNNRTIEMIINEQDNVGHYLVKGQIQIGKKFSALGINQDVSYAPEELSKKLKMLRNIFDSKAEHANIVNALRQIKAKLKQDIEKNDDSRGNISASFEQKLESNVPEKFKLKLPLIEGEDAVLFDVHIFIQGTSYSNLECYLESVDAADIIEEITNKRLDEEAKFLAEYMVVIEQ